MARKRIGELLLERGAISLKQLEEALASQRVTRERLGAVLVRQGALSEAQLALALAEALGLPPSDLARRVPTKEALEKVRVRFCEAHDLLPLALETRKGRKVLVVAMADPLDVPAQEELSFTTGLKVEVEVAPISRIRDGILRHYHDVERAEAAPLLADDAVIEDEEGEILEGEEVTQSGRPVKARRKLASDLDYLVGAEEAQAQDALERKFWALMRVLEKKGLVTKAEFLKELGEKD